MNRRWAVLCFTIIALLALPAIQAAGRPGRPHQDSTPVVMVLIPRGSFMMGSPQTEPQSRVDEQRHRVVLTRPFWLSATEVTQALWQEVMGTNPSYFADCPGCPVERVSWYEAVEFCNALSLRDGLTPAYAICGTDVVWLRDTDGYRLPTEAEWEYACRAGTATPFATGACLPDDRANYDAYRPLSPGCAEGMSRGETVEVAGFPPNAWGLYDMHGNVAEWCWDWYRPYDPAAGRDPAGPAKGEKKMIRGGAWGFPADQSRSAFRSNVKPTTRLDLIGLRVARSFIEAEEGR